MPTQNSERERFTEYYKIYAENSPDVSMLAEQGAQSKVANGDAASSQSAGANRTIGTRQAAHGSSTMTPAGAQNSKDKSKQRTQSQNNP